MEHYRADVVGVAVEGLDDVFCLVVPHLNGMDGMEWSEMVG